MVAYLLCSLPSSPEELRLPVPVREPHVACAQSPHAAPATHRDRCTAVGLPEDGSPDALSARQAYGNPPYHGPVAGRQAVAHGARRERAPLARSAAQLLHLNVPALSIQATERLSCRQEGGGQGEQAAGRTQRAKRRGASQHVEERTPSEVAQRAKRAVGVVVRKHRATHQRDLRGLKAST